MNNKTLYIVIAVAVIVIVGGVWWYMQGQYVGAPNNYSAGQNSSPSTESTSTTISSGTPAKLSYEKAMALYGDRRIQFDSKCVVTPNFPTFKIGTTIMLDNRSNKTRIISLDGADYAVKAYDYAVVTLHTGASLPHTMYIDCANGESNGRVLLQK